MNEFNSSVSKHSNQANASLYGEQTQHALENFTISDLTLQLPFIKALAHIKYACAQANNESDILDKQIALAIMDAAHKITLGNYKEQFVVDVFQTGSGTSANMNMNEVLASLASQDISQPVHPNDDVNKGQSSNDVIPSALYLSASAQISEHLLPALDSLINALESKATQIGHVIKTGRTHLMDALPISFGQEFSGWIAQLRKAQQRIRSSQLNLNQLALGGTAIGTGINAKKGVAKRACEILSLRYGFDVYPADNYFAAISSQDSAVEMSGQLKTLAVSLLKLCHDLRWMNSGPLNGLAEIQLKKLQAGSSIMPSKVNPVIPEAVTMACAQVMGNDVTISFSGQGGNFQLNTMLPVIAYNLLQSIQVMANSAQSLATKVIPDIQVNEKHLTEKMEYNPILATALNPLIGYEKATQIAQKALKSGKTVLEVAMADTNIDIDTLKQLLNPNTLLGSG